MGDFYQVPFGSMDFAENPSLRVPGVLVLDTSASMQGEKINQLNQGLVTFANELQADARRDIREVAIITFGPVEVLDNPPFITADEFSPVTLSAQSSAPMGEAIVQAIDLCRQRKDELKAAGMAYDRPWIFLITDGSPTDDVTAAKAEIESGEEARNFVFYAVGVEGANMNVLADLSVREPLKLKGISFREMFQPLEIGLPGLPHSDPPDPKGPSGWAFYT